LWIIIQTFGEKKINNPLFFSIFAIVNEGLCVVNVLKMKNIVVFASGSGSNAENLISFFKESTVARVIQIFTNNKDAYVVERARKLGIPCEVFGREDFYNNDLILSKLIDSKTDLIVLAGFLWLVPSKLVKAFPQRIVNIHPALLPKYGGKGMFGQYVHNAVVANKETQSGITIHFVDEHYDEGAVIFQASCEISESDTPDDVAQKVHQLEYRYYPEIIEKVVNQLP
jgi:phosphoribosylglycinamide formyltransferase-1